MASLLMEGLIEGGIIAGESAPEIAGAIETAGTTALGGAAVGGKMTEEAAARASEEAARAHTLEAPVEGSTADKVREFFTPEPGAKPARDTGWKMPDTPIPKIPLSEKVVHTIFGKDLGFAAEDEVIKDMKILEKLQIHNTSKGTRLPNTKYLEHIVESIDKDGTISHPLEDLKNVHKPLFKSNANIVNRRPADLLKNYPVGSKGGGNPGIQFVNRLPRSILKAIDGSKILTSEEKVQLLKGQVGRNRFTTTNELVDRIIAKHSKVAKEMPEIVEEVPKPVQESIAAIETEAEKEPEKFKADIQKSVPTATRSRVLQRVKELNLKTREAIMGDNKNLSLFSRKIAPKIRTTLQEEMAKRGLQSENVAELDIQMTTNPSAELESELRQAKSELEATRDELKSLKSIDKDVTEYIKGEDNKVSSVLKKVEDVPDEEFKEVFEKSTEKIENPETKEELLKKLTPKQKELLRFEESKTIVPKEFVTLLDNTKNPVLRARLTSLLSDEEQLALGDLSTDFKETGSLDEGFIESYKNIKDTKVAKKIFDILTDEEKAQLHISLTKLPPKVVPTPEFKELIEDTANLDLRNRLLSLADVDESTLDTPDVFRVGVDPLTERFMSLYQRNWLEYPDIQKVLTKAERTQLNEYLKANKLIVTDPVKFKEDFISFINKIKSPDTKLKLYANLTQDEKNLLGKNFFKEKMQVLVDESERLKKNISLPKTMEPVEPIVEAVEEAIEPVVEQVEPVAPVEPTIDPSSATGIAESEGVIGEPQEAVEEFTEDEKAGFFTSERLKDMAAGVLGTTAAGGLIAGIVAGIDRLKSGDFSDVKKALNTATKVVNTIKELEKDFNKYLRIWNSSGNNRVAAESAKRKMEETKKELDTLQKAKAQAGGDLKRALTKANDNIKKQATDSNKKAIADKEFASKNAKKNVQGGILKDTSLPSIKIYNNIQSPESFLKSEDDFSTVQRKNVNSKNKTKENKASNKSKIIHDDPEEVE